MGLKRVAVAAAYLPARRAIALSPTRVAPGVSGGMLIGWRADRRDPPVSSSQLEVFGGH